MVGGCLVLVCSSVGWLAGWLTVHEFGSNKCGTFLVRGKVLFGACQISDK